MKTLLLFVFFFTTISASAQITAPTTRAHFGVDRELRLGVVDQFSTQSDDWFMMGTGSEPSNSKFVIDTTGAAAIVARYQWDAAFRRQPFYRTMRFPPYTLVGPDNFQRAWIDAVYIRDYNGNPPGDETAFVLANKNGDSPANWTGGTVDSWGNVGDKVDISDMLVHVRREGATATSNLWFFGGLSIQGTNGDRYFDFELYQTDIFFSRITGQFSGYGPDAGHTTWQFDASGNVITSGDVIFSAHFGTAGLQSIEARIWIDRASLNITPSNFDWSGSFDGASNNAQYGYASIRPKTSGSYYIGNQSANGTWAGPFGFINLSNNYTTTYSAGQFMEMGVNLTFLGLDPMTILGGSGCGLPFRRILVKTRTSNSFTSSLKDFIGPFDFFTSNPLDAWADVPMYCGSIGVSELTVTSPSTGSVYTWTTPDGNIVTTPIGPTITVDAPGMYIVTQQLLDGCSPSAADTVLITYDPGCIPMSNRITDFRGNIRNKVAQTSWITRSNRETVYFEVERSTNGRDFETVGRVQAVQPQSEQEYFFDDNVAMLGSPHVYYRLKVKMTSGSFSYSGILKLGLNVDQKDVNVFPNPVKDVLQISVPSSKLQEARISVFDISGAFIKSTSFNLREGVNVLQVDAFGLKPGNYMVQVVTENQNVWKKFMVNPMLYNK